MPFINYNETPHLKIWDGIHGAIHHSEHMTHAQIILEEGAVAAMHQHMHEQWTHVFEGELEFTLDGQTQIMTSGMSVFIPSNTPHSAKALTRCKVLDAFSPPREDFKTLEPWTTN